MIVSYKCPVSTLRLINGFLLDFALLMWFGVRSFLTAPCE